MFRHKSALSGINFLGPQELGTRGKDGLECSLAEGYCVDQAVLFPCSVLFDHIYQA